MPTIMISGGVPQARLRPSKHGQPSSATVSQSLSMVSQFIIGPSAIPGRTVASESLQSGPQATPLQHADEAEPSPSASVKPSVSELQSSSCPSHPSVLPGNARASASSQSSPIGAPDRSTHESAPWPSPSSSGGVCRQVRISSEHESRVHPTPSSQSTTSPGTHPFTSARSSAGSHVSSPLQNAPSEH